MARKFVADIDLRGKLFAANVSTTPGTTIQIVGGATTNTTGTGGAVTITGGAATTGTSIATGGAVTISGGASNTTNGVGGNVTINGGLGSAANGNGDISIGTSNTDSVTIGASGKQTLINGTVTIENPLLKSVSTVGGGGGEGGQINFARVTDGTQYWAIDSFGTTSTPDLRVIEGVNERFRIVAGGAISVGGGTGTSGQILTSSGSGSAPTWATPGTTPVIKVAANRTTSTTGTTALTVNTGETFAITFPSGRFSVSPAVTAATSSPRYIAGVTQVTTSGFTLSVRNVSDASGTTYLYHWMAIEIVAGMGN